MFERRLLTWMFLLSAALLVSSGAYATWGPSDLVATQTAQKATVTPSWTQSGSIYTYTYVLANTTLSDIDSFYLTMPAEVDVAGLWGFSGPSGWRFSVRAVSLLDWTNNTGDAIAPTETGTFSFSTNYAPSTSMIVVAACEGGRAFSGDTYGPAPEPGSMLALMTGFIGLAGLKLRRR